ncbi:Gmad2 immunoglobulin-like domain-containing protein [Cellulomonas aerilata]|uniref:GerMN domain-containing protein n=1 Tax=Cellulomonas aerilata TaxID=515326 RepID=A0A512DAI9_9CELL|nr:Gmad2 immunoglobulin-like domain-containing protein [Cellulomonas aerilata]GEO33250.1 hypothetical protein CAE01nite_09750 [Cellulomonas aerilata]
MAHRRPVVLAVVLTALVAGCTSGDPQAPPSTAGPSPSPSATTTPTPSPTASPVPQVVPVYYLVDTRAGIRLARETATTTGTDPVRAAVERMIAGAEDPDYTTAWDPGTRVLGVDRTGAAIVVDLSAEARTATVGSEGAATMVQQLVWTVTDAADADTTPVLLTVDGAPAGELWGAVSWTEPVPRQDPLSVRQLVQIDQPTEGAATGSPVTVAGEAAVFEATLPWRVLDTAGAEVTSGFTTTSEGQVFAPFSFTLELAPGTYTVEISEDDPSDGEAGTPMTDTRTITVS